MTNSDAHDAEAYRKQKERMRIHYQSWRAELLTALGGQCKKCGIKDFRVLQLDHINGGGYEDKKARQGNYRYYQKILNDPNRLNKFQLLCANCNWIKKYENKENSGYLKK